MKLILALLIGFSAYSQTNVHLEDFNSGIGTWTSFENGDPTSQWTSTGNSMQINGVASVNDEDWLISPSINLNAQTNEYLLFDYNDINTGAIIELLYSTDYSGSGIAIDIVSATWINLQLNLIDLEDVSCFTTLLQRHPSIDIGGINGTSVYFAFRAKTTNGIGKQYQIDNVHIEADYYDSVTTFINNGGGGCEALKTEIHDLIVYQTIIQYTASSYDLWDAILNTDKRLNDAGSSIIVWDMFTDIPTGAEVYEFDHCADRDGGSCPGGEGQCYNREHTFPQSWWGGGQTPADTQRVDLHHVVPSDRSLNSSKSNNPPGIVTVPTTTGSNGFKVGLNPAYPCTSNYYEPIDEYKGDYARMYLYVGTRYEHNMVAWSTISTEGDCAMSGDPYTCYEPWLLDLLLQWHNADPVSTKEIDRNNAIYAIQGNRNPYVDNPQWVALIWGDGTNPCDLGLNESTNTKKELVKIVDLTGRQTKFIPNTPLIYIYADGTTEKVFKLEE